MESAEEAGQEPDVVTVERLADYIQTRLWDLSGNAPYNSVCRELAYGLLGLEWVKPDDM